MSTNGALPEQTALSVLLFHTAMTRELSLSRFAKEMDIGAISLRQFILGNTQRPRQKTLEMMAHTLNMSVEEVREHMEILPEAGPNFGVWLDEQMMRQGKMSRARLTRDTNISDGALRNYLAGKTVPDTDQAQRLAQVLGVDSFEIARIIVANTVIEAGGKVATPSNAVVATVAPVEEAAQLEAPVAGSLAPAMANSQDETRLLGLWRQMHPQGRRATLGYIAMLLAES